MLAWRASWRPVPVFGGWNLPYLAESPKQSSSLILAKPFTTFIHLVVYALNKVLILI